MGRRYNMARSSSFSNMVIVLVLVSLVSSAILGGVYALTKDAIDAVGIAKLNAGIAEVVPAFNNNPYGEAIVKEIDGRPITLYPARKDGQLTGVAVETSTTKGFSGLIVLMAGFLPDGTINTISVISHAETPGLGDKIEKSKGTFSLQFEGKNPEDFKLLVKKDGGDVDAITASTISSRAFCDAMERAYRAFKEMKNE
jgi:electron transport complex protein RnfG